MLNIHMKYDEISPIQFEVTFLGVTKIINAETQSVSFEVDIESTYEIEFVQKEVNEKFSAMQKFMYILFIPIIGLFSGIFMYGELMSVFRKINPYIISKTIVLKIETDTQVNVVYTRPIYNKSLRMWTEPNLLFSNIKYTNNYAIEDNTNDFENCYVNFKRFFVAIYFDVILLFLVFAFIALQKEDKQVFVAFSCLSLSVLLLCLITLIAVKRKITRMKISFIKLNAIKNK